MKVQLRGYQAKGIESLRGEYRGQKKSVLYVLPTGGGKTVVFTHIAESIMKKSKSVYILVHRKELLIQCSRHLYNLGIPHGRISPSFSMTKDKIQVCSVQTLVKRLDYYHEPDLIIVDEAHHITAGSWRKIIEYYKNARVLGVTATPVRSDGHGLGSIFQSMIIGPSMSYLIEKGYLSKPVVYAPAMIDVTGLKKRGGDFEKEELVKRADKPSITGSAVEHYRKLAHKVPAIAFCCSVQHAKHVAEQFREAGYIAKSIDGEMDDTERSQAIEDLGKGKIDVLTSCDIVSEGTDIPIVGCGILLRPTDSLGLFLQQTGRVLRPYPGKKEAIILDHAGNCLRFGLPEEEREWSLDGDTFKKKKRKKDDEKDIMVKQCPACFYVHKPAPVCPKCNHQYQVQYRKVEQKDGELIKIEAIQRQKKVEVATAKSFEDLLRIEKQRGYKPGWAKYVYDSRLKKLAKKA